ncbi:MAG TPA: flagellar motor protein MotB [Terracidiphilus sp.]|nr:flagellar motor protein MotB [Terracidiphilus sp.]
MMQRRSRGRVSHERWLVSYADFITLLFAFFVVLYAFAKADERKQAQVSEAIDSAFKSFGVLSNATAETPPRESAYTATGLPSSPPATITGESVLTPGRVKADLDKIRHELQQSMAKEISEHTVSIHMGRDGLVISLREAGFFDSGSALPHSGAQATLKRIAVALAAMPYDVRVEGHTDNIPIHTDEFASNWELSSARATRIARVFLAMHAIAPDRLSAAGYAEFHPLASNDTAEGRATNRRVDLVILPRTKLDFAALPQGATVEDQSGKATGSWAKITDQ